MYSIISRFHPDGRPDLSFGVEGEAIYTSSFFLPNSIAIQEDGKIVAAGNNQMSFALVRYLPDGTLDSSFGVNGEVITDFDKYADFIQDILIQPDGKIVAAGAAGNNSFNQDKPFMGVARYNTDGSLDKSFGEEGKANIKFNNVSKANSVSLQQNGKILIAGFETNEHNDFAIARLTENGIPDSSFGINAKIVTDIRSYSDRAIKVGIQKDGRIIAGGQEVTTENVYSTVLVGYHGDPVATNPLITQMKSWIQDSPLGWYIQNSNSVGYFGIERSNNGTDFTQVQRISPRQVSMPNASANKEEVYHYALRGADAGGYYRIKAVMQDGSKVYSDVVAFNTNNKENNVSIAPNPVNNVLTVKGLQPTKHYTLSVMDISGNMVLNTKVKAAATTQLQVSRLKPGRYLLSVKSGTAMQTLQFVKE